MSLPNEILDDNLKPYLKNKKGIFKFFTLSIGTILLFLIMVLLEYYLNPDSWQNNNEPSSVSIFITMFLFLFNSIQAAKYLNEFDCEMSKLRVVVYSGINLFLVTMLFILFQGLIIYEKREEDLITTPFLTVLLGIPISNLRIHFIRKSKLFWPIIIFCILWFITIVFVI